MDENHPLAAKHPYGVSKIAADRLCYTYNETYDLGVDILRCFNFFGPKQKDTGYGGVIAIFINRVLQKRPPIIYRNGEQTRDYMYIQDAVKATLKTLGLMLSHFVLLISMVQMQNLINLFHLL